MKRVNRFLETIFRVVLASVVLLAIPALAEPVSEADSKYVCMINNKVFPKEQIPTVVEKKIYYGCCEMCASRLSSDSQVRSAIDPISGKEVDKASAVVGVNSEGHAYYFENKENLEAFSKRPAAKKL